MSGDVHTLDDLRRAAELLPVGAMLTLSREALLTALNGHHGGGDRNGDGQGKGGASAAAPDRLLSAKEVAQRLATSARYVYAHRRSFPFTKELPGGAIRFSERGLTRWIERRP
jgi:predicted DNA-binding transcriptional regulator AlpA